MKFSLPSIQHDRAGFENLVALNMQTQDYYFESITIELTGWFDADMCAAFGAILYRLGENANSVQLIVRRPRVEEILSKNGFLSNYGRAQLPDTWGTTIPYQRFDVKDDRYFSRYIETRLANRREIPTMSAGLVKKFRESVFEIFSNAVLHAHTDLGIFGCGQFFPARQRINFAVADLGIGIRSNVLEHTGQNLSSIEAIIWATEGRNTTKRGAIPGGLGLKLLREFIAMNGGGIQIVSDTGYWKQEQDQVTTTLLPHPFPGTVVALEIDTSDIKSYALANELSPADIF
ncbi:MAG: ATP-binding protein [Anaerolineae bacterium]|nr:ATP-binding protein [Anaerolineae bacterium]